MCSRVGGGVSDAPPGLAVPGEEAERPLLGGEGADPPTSRGHCEYTPGTGEENKYYTFGFALQRKSHLFITFLGIALPQSKFPSCVCERFIYSQDRSTYFLQQNWQKI